MTDESIRRSIGRGSESALTAFLRLVMGDEVMQARLGGIEIPEAFVEQAMTMAAMNGIALTAETIKAATRPDPLGIGRWSSSPVAANDWPPRGWLPARSVPTGGKPAFDWAWFGSDPLDAPFYEDSVRRFASRPFSQMFRTRTGLDALVKGSESKRAGVPSGFLYHMSRCGSTLVAQMLAANPLHIVLSEPEPLDAVLRWAAESTAPNEEKVNALRAVAAALGRNRTGEIGRLFIKLDSWHALLLPLLRSAFPDTPWVFLYRDPVEVLVSQIRRRGTHTVAGLLPKSIIDIPGAETLPDDRYAALALAEVCQAVIANWQLGGGVVVNYSELPHAVFDRIVPHFRLTPSPADRAGMEVAATRDAKAPERRFVPDVALKRREASTALEAVAREALSPVCDRLSAMRMMNDTWVRRR